MGVHALIKHQLFSQFLPTAGSYFDRCYENIKTHYESIKTKRAFGDSYIELESNVDSMKTYCLLNISTKLSSLFQRSYKKL